MDEISGAVERIDDPDVFIFVVQIGGSAGFFGQNSVAGIGILQDFDDRLLGSLIHFGHEIVMLFFGDRYPVEVERGAIDDRGAATGGLDRRIEHGMHSGSVKMAALFTGTSAANRTAQHELKSDAVYS